MKIDILVTSNYFDLNSGGLDSDEPWRGRWERGVLVECVGQQEKEEGQEK